MEIPRHHQRQFPPIKFVQFEEQLDRKVERVDESEGLNEYGKEESRFRKESVG